MNLGDAYCDYALRSSSAASSDAMESQLTPPESPEPESPSLTLGELFRSLATEQRRLADLLFRWAYENADSAVLADAAEAGGGEEGSRDDGREVLFPRAKTSAASPTSRRR